MKDKLYCTKCKKLIGYTELVYGEEGNYFCDSCFNKPKAVGRDLSPCYKQGKEYIRNTKQSFDEASAASLQAIQAKYGRPTNVRLVRTVDYNLRVHSKIENVSCDD